MTRDEIENYINHKKKYGNSKSIVKVLSVSDVGVLVDKIIDEFKAQTCENCKYFSENSGRQPDGMGWREAVCEYYDGNFSIAEVVDDSFGCNSWEKKC